MSSKSASPTTRRHYCSAEHATNTPVRSLVRFCSAPCGGLSDEEIGSLLGVSERTVRNDWVHARAWLAQALSEAGGAG